ncbi:MAG TPA: hypothetical protein VGE35_04610 [Candidatus Paceibacterota bacterium]
MFREIKNTGSIRFFQATLGLFVLFFGFLGFYYGVPLCDKSNNIDCTYYLLAAVFILSLAATIALQAFKGSQRYMNFQNKPTVERLTGVLEILIGPIIAFIYHTVNQFMHGWPQQDRWMGIWYETLLDGHISKGAWIDLTAIFLAIFFVADGLRRLLTKRPVDKHTSV